MTMTVLLNSGPWLPVPPNGYGGIENVVAALVPELRRRGVSVVLASVGESTLAVDELIAVHRRGRFARLQEPFSQVMGTAAAHLHRIVTELRRREDIDIVHDHQEALGPTVLGALGVSGPPILHTLHWDLRKHPDLYGAFDGGGRMWVNGVSASQVATAPPALRAACVGHVHLATPLAVDADRRDRGEKSDHLVVLGRITANKGQHVAAQVAHRTGRRLVLAGPVGPHHRAVDLARADDTNPDVRYWREQVEPLVDGVGVRWVGTVEGWERDTLVESAEAMLCPVAWDEPGGTAVVESLALGTPVVGYRRGCLPELVDDGHTGLLVEPGDVDGLAAAVQKIGALDPRACCEQAALRFTPARMADRYRELYDRVIAQSSEPGTIRSPFGGRNAPHVSRRGGPDHR